MNTKDKEQVVNTLTEAKIKIKIGRFFFMLRQPTLAQIYEMGAVASKINATDLNLEQRINVIAETIEHYKDARILQDTAIILLFRNKVWRWLWKRYIFKHITIDDFNQIILAISKSFNINFFLTSIIFLRQTTRMTEPNSTTALGQLSEE
jgi:hypothetical protein